MTLPPLAKSTGILSVVLVILLTPTFSEGGPVSFLTALPIAQGQGIFRGQYFLIRGADDPTLADRDLTVHVAPMALVVGATSRLAIFGIVPFLHKSMDVTTPVGRIARGTSGIGDTMVFARYTILAVDGAGSTFRIAPFAGVEFPTGKSDDVDQLGRLPRPLQLGSGSWDGLVGVVATWQTLGWELDADLSYQRNTEAEDFTFGDKVSADLSFQYRLWPTSLGAGVPGFWYGVAESNLTWSGHNQDVEIDDPNSGGTRWDLDIGLQYVTTRYVLEGIIQIPTVERLNGTALETGYQVRAGVRWNFPFGF